MPSSIRPGFCILAGFVTAVVLLCTFVVSHHLSNRAVQEQSPELANQLFSRNVPWKNLDPWFRDYGPEVLREREQPPQENFVVVIDEFTEEAAALLAEVSAAAISETDALRFTRGELQVREGLSPYVVRAVSLEAGNGGFTVYRSRNSIITQFSCLGRSAAPMRRAVLVVLLPSLPEEVYVSCTMIA